MSSPSPGISFPCYTIMNDACDGSVTMPRPDGALTTVLFTCEEKVRRFRDAAPMRFGPTVKFDSPYELLLYFKAFPPNETHFGTDPEKPGDAVLTAPVAGMMGALRKWLDGQA